MNVPVARPVPVQPRVFRRAAPPGESPADKDAHVTEAAPPIPRPFASPIPAWPLARSPSAWLAGLTVGLVGLLILLLVTPGKTFVGIYVNDLMVFFDGAHRLLSGQIPNRDFHTPLGPLAYLLPAIGLKVGGHLGLMLPIATAIFALLLAPALFYVCATRLPFPLAVIVLLYVALLAVAPLNPGDPWVNSTFAMFYNRFCWAALSTLLVLVLPHRRPGVGGPILDAVCASWLLALLFYLKLSYAAVGAAFVVALLFLPGKRRLALLTAAGAAVALLVGEMIWGETARYLADATAAARVSGALRGGLYVLAMSIGQNLHQEAVFAAAFLIGVMRRTRLAYLAASAIMAGAGLMLLNQNAQFLEIPLLLPAALAATLGPTAGADAGHDADRSGAFSLATLLLVGALALPGIANDALALRYFRHELRHAPPSPASLAELDGVVTHEGTLVPTDGRPAMPVAPNALADAIRTGVGDTRTLLLLRQIPSRQPLSQTEYLQTLQDGAAALRADPSLAGPVYTFDLQNPFNAMLDRAPPRGDNSWNHFGRTFDQHRRLPPEEALRTVQVVMDPKDPMEVYSAHFQKTNYADYLARHFRLAKETTYWRIYARTPSKAEP